MKKSNRNLHLAKKTRVIFCTRVENYKIFVEKTCEKNLITNIQLSSIKIT